MAIPAVIRIVAILGAAVCLVAPDGLAQAVHPDNHADSVSARTDTIQPRIGRDRAPASLEIGQAYTFTRDEFFASGAVTVTDVLSRIPGITTFQTGWIHTPQIAAYNGDFGRIRMFLDGIELDELNPRQGGIVDVSAMPLWALREMTITRGANEVRIDLRTWEYNSVNPYTRFDMYTGDLNTTVYRGFYGKRFFNGVGLQLSGERYNVSDARIRSGGDKTTLLGRYGIARDLWSLDATFFRYNATRTITQRLNSLPAMPPYRGVHGLAYLRGAIGKEGEGPFVQLVAAFRNFKESSPNFDTTRAGEFGFIPDQADTSVSMNQYVATVGFDRWGGKIRFVDRYRTINGRGFNAASLSFDYTASILALQTSVESDAYTGFRRAEAAARVQPLPFFAVSAALGQRSANASRTSQPNSRSARLDVGVRVPKGPWLIGGIVNRDTAVLVPPLVFDTAFRHVSVNSMTGTTLAARGPVFRDITVDAAVTHWGGESNMYVPEVQATAELRYFNDFLKRFPRGTFSFLFAPRIDYRSRVAFPLETGTVEAGAATTFSLLAELRILRGIITYQYRNMGGLVYNQVPGYLMPRSVNYYGVRWYFYY